MGGEGEWLCSYFFWREFVKVVFSVFFIYKKRYDEI